jgi:hypothetical protein
MGISMGGSKVSEKHSTALEFRSNGRRAGARMSSVADVKPLTRELGNMFAPHEGWQQQVSAIHRKLTAPEFPWAIEDLTWSRVKTWFFGEVRRIDYDHMVALKELKATEEARREHRQFIATTNRMAALLAAEGTALSRAQLETLARLSGGQIGLPSDSDAGQGGEVRDLVGAGAAE